MKKSGIHLITFYLPINRTLDNKFNFLYQRELKKSHEYGKIIYTYCSMTQKKTILTLPLKLIIVYNTTNHHCNILVSSNKKLYKKLLEITFESDDKVKISAKFILLNI